MQSPPAAAADENLADRLSMLIQTMKPIPAPVRNRRYDVLIWKEPVKELLGDDNMLEAKAASALGIRPPVRSTALRERDKTPHRPPWGGEQRPSRAAPVGGRAHIRLAGPVPAHYHALRTPRRSPPRLHNPRMRRHLSAPDQTVLFLTLTQQYCWKHGGTLLEARRDLSFVM